MTESFRRSGEYETPKAHEPQSAYPQQHVASSPVNPEWPPPPSYGPPTVQQPAAPVTAPAAQHGKRAKGPFALLHAVAIVAAATGGGTAYGIQELTNSGSAVTSSSTSTNVVPSSVKGTVSGVAAETRSEEHTSELQSRLH